MPFRMIGVRINKRAVPKVTWVLATVVFRLARLLHLPRAMGIGYLLNRQTASRVAFPGPLPKRNKTVPRLTGTGISLRMDASQNPLLKSNVMVQIGIGTS